MELFGSNMSGWGAGAVAVTVGSQSIASPFCAPTCEMRAFALVLGGLSGLRTHGSASAILLRAYVGVCL